ncbi:IS21 family transposase [Deferribacter autotrophicus]|uniref:IS21 family transposase n=1 Tax=Deferribacter autotrophicus TaxID=500465 RepID=A0A5A8F7G4_9BACT|nr:IS21 family transposase [Deferribacter autotrophicus]KAA0259349.1 IS21 family transposase [Deferribacter autotrophicus]
MYYTVKTLLSQGKNISEISRELGIDRKTVRKIRDKVKDGKVETPKFSRVSVLEAYKEEIIEYLSEGLTAVLIHQKLTRDHDLSVSYSCVKKYVRKLKGPDGIYVPLISPPGEEAQVDFGYIGYFYDKSVKKKVKCWIFCMVLSHSRYKYYEIVRSQDVETFLRCHINAFEYFGGIPRVIKIDNLKSGVLKANFYEPVIQKEYAAMLEYYGSSSFACKVRYPQEKGKVESGIKYVKNNFFKSIKERDLDKVKIILRDWQENICNKKIHGTTRKVPYEQFMEKEKSCLLSIPGKRYEVYEVSERIVNRYSHITYKYNYYSVPYKYVGSKVNIRSNGSILKIYNEKFEEIAVHTVSKLTGEFITNKAHNPKLTQSDYKRKSLEIGLNTLEFYERLKGEKPRHYHRMMQGIFSLLKVYDREIIDLACKRANKHNSISYLSVKKICESGIYSISEPEESVKCSGYGHNLQIYDEILNGRIN